MPTVVALCFYQSAHGAIVSSWPVVMHWSIVHWFESLTCFTSYHELSSLASSSFCIDYNQELTRVWALKERSVPLFYCELVIFYVVILL